MNDIIEFFGKKWSVIETMILDGCPYVRVKDSNDNKIWLIDKGLKKVN